MTSGGPHQKADIALCANRKATMNQQNRFPLVAVTWADAHAGPEHWEELEHDNNEYLCLTVGILVDAEHGGKRDHVTVAQSQTPDDLFDHVLFIPVGMVRDIKILSRNP